jgi:hypothetical protein
VAVAIALVAAHPRISLVALSYTYVITALIAWVYMRLRRRPDSAAQQPAHSQHPSA